MQVVFYILAFLILVLSIAVVVRWQYSEGYKIVNRWSQATGVELVSVQMRYWQTGPFTFYTRGQFVFRIAVRDRTGGQRSGWILVGSWYGGVLSDETKVIWDA